MDFKLMGARLAGAAALIAVPLAAQAADLPFKAPVYAPPLWSWTGFYVGANAGYSWGPWDSANPPGITNFPTGTGFTNTVSPKVNGWLGGLQAGYNWQKGHLVFGLEGDIQITGERASDPGSASSIAVTNPCLPFANCVTTTTTTSTVTNDWKLPWFSTLRGRLGVTADPTLLLYATGGLAIAGTQYANSTVVTSVSTGAAPGSATLVNSSLSESSTRAGVAIGAGIEKAFARNWTVKAEYLYLDFGTHTFLAGTGFDTSVRLRDHIARLGINYKFDY